jgi:NAD(P)-dependent dehydrogenase (short-subunit alcohol dehydrogenase family)
VSQNTLTDKTVLITGASSGIGWATALEMAPFRPKLAIAARRADKLAELAQALGPDTMILTCDVSDPAQGRAAIEEVVNRWGRLDFLINNAGIMATTQFHLGPAAEIDQVMRTNYVGAANLIHAALPHMLKQKDGHIVNVASLAGLMGVPYMAAYCASKWALVGLTEALRREYYDSGVTFTAFCPGSVDTPMTEASLRDKTLRMLTRPKTAEQVARKIIHCCLNRTPEYIYGETPGWLAKAIKLVPRFADWATANVVHRVHPLAKSAGARH